MSEEAKRFFNMIFIFFYKVLSKNVRLLRRRLIFNIDFLFLLFYSNNVVWRIGLNKFMLIIVI